ncbi:MAG: hypothetical protein IT353_05100 [Gemmatimonadaceae bacterium]|nr:hypothetical protein [Gemmatimonadaceae bacterium]
MSDGHHARVLRTVVKGIAVVMCVPAFALEQPRSDLEVIQEVALSTLATAIQRQTGDNDVVFWVDSASIRERLARTTGVHAATATQLTCSQNVCRVPAHGVRVLFVGTPTVVREGLATVTTEELRGMTSPTNVRWTDRMVHTLNVEKKGGAWTVTSGTTTVR